MMKNSKKDIHEKIEGIMIPIKLYKDLTRLKKVAVSNNVFGVRSEPVLKSEQPVMLEKQRKNVI